MQQSARNKIISFTVVIAVIVLLTVAASALKKEENATASVPSDSNTVLTDTTTTAASDNTSQTTTPATTDVSGVAYKDGTYSSSDSYSSPGGTEDITVKITVASNKITAVSVTQKANNHESEEYQSDFQSGYKSKVVGKALSTLELSRVSGASLTTKGFNDALDAIRSQAEA